MNRKKVVQREHLAPSIPLSYSTDIIKSLKSHLKAPYIIKKITISQNALEKVVLFFSLMSIQTQHSISHLLYVSSVPIVYRKGGVIFKIKISFNIYQEKKAGVTRGEHQRISSLRSCGHTTPTFQFLQSNRSL